MPENLIVKLTALGAPSVLLVGDFMLDTYVYGDADRISPEAPVPVLKVVKREYRCGGAASVAAALSALGTRPTCLVDPFNVARIHEGILKIISDPAYRDELVRQGLENAKRFLPEKIAQEYVNIYTELLAR